MDKQREMKEKCNNPEPSPEYGRDEFDDLHFYCINCGKEVISIIKNREEEKWFHGKIGTIPILDQTD
jgi:hypothetical protein